MPFLVVIAGVYVAYQTSLERERKLTKAPSDYQLDPSIDRTNKSYIRLLPVEVELCLFELPITTLSFFEGSYETVAIHLEERLKAIIAKNPWLGGWLIRDENENYDVKILYDELGQDVAPGYFQVYEPYVIPVGRNFDSYHDVGKKMDAMGATVPMNAKLIGQNKPFWKVSIIPDVDAPTERFALAFSMSHAVADAHSYYKIFSMLDQDSRIEALQPLRNHAFGQEMAEFCGPGEADYVYLRRVTERQPPPPEPRQWRQQSQQLPSNRKRRPLSASHVNKERVVFKMFFVNEDWLLRRKGRRSSVFDVQTDCASMTASMVGRGDSASTEARLPYKNRNMATVVSANSMLTSWFFNVTRPELGLMSANMRNRLAGISDNDMGNYQHTILYTPVDYQSPGLIQESLKSMRRCGSDPISTLPPLFEEEDTTAEQGSGPTKAPKPTSFASSISTNWARLCPEREIYLIPDRDDDDSHSKKDEADAANDDAEGDDNGNINKSAAKSTTTATSNSAGSDSSGASSTTRQTLHIPIFTFQELEVFPDTLSCIAIFTASPRGEGSQERRPGAWVICKESIWLSQIQDCGIVDEMIAEMTMDRDGR